MSLDEEDDGSDYHSIKKKAPKKMDLIGGKKICYKRAEGWNYEKIIEARADFSPYFGCTEYKN